MVAGCAGMPCCGDFQHQSKSLVLVFDEASVWYLVVNYFVGIYDFVSLSSALE